MMIQIAVIAILAIVILDISLRVYFGRKSLQLLEKMPPFHVESTAPQKQATQFNVTTADGLTLRGSMYHPDEMPPQGIIVYCPETCANHWSAIKYCQSLIDAGFIVVSFDFRNQGESDSVSHYEPLYWVTEYEVQDLETVLDWINEQDSLRGLPVGLMGVSRGAATALITLSRRDDVQFVCSDSGYTNDLLIWHYLERWAPIVLPKILMKSTARWLWHVKVTLDIAIRLRGWKRNCRYILGARPFEKMVDKKVLLISGARDSYVPAGITRKIERKLGSQCQAVWIAPKANHNGARLQDPETYDAYLTNFFTQMVTVRPAGTPRNRPHWNPALVGENEAV